MKDLSVNFLNKIVKKFWKDLGDNSQAQERIDEIYEVVSNGYCCECDSYNCDHRIPYELAYEMESESEALQEEIYEKWKIAEHNLRVSFLEFMQKNPLIDIDDIESYLCDFEDDNGDYPVYDIIKGILNEKS